MKSRTSFFNTTVLRKDITRFAPVWGLYTIGLLLFMFVPYLEGDTSDTANMLADCMSTMVLVNIIYGGISALMVFGDLFKTRLCYATHALPLRREGWFLTHFTAGMLFSLVPNLLLALLFLPLLQGSWYMSFLWLAVMLLQYLFFFGTGAFCAVCAGSRLGAAAAYLIVHFGLLLVEWYADNLFVPLLYGMEYRGTVVELMMPVSYISDLEFISFTRRPFTLNAFIFEDWLYVGIVAAIGVLLSVLAVLIYRKRNLETAGDFLSLPAAKPVFLVIYTLTVGFVVSQMIYLRYLGLFVGLFIGFFTGKMLLERTVKVFRGWNFLGFGVIVSVLALAVGLTALDPFGVTRYVPDTEDVEALYFYDSSDSHLYLYEDSTGREIRDSEKIEQFRQLHLDVCDGRYQDADESTPDDVNTVSVYLQYELKSGRTVLRRYEIPVETTHGAFIRRELSDWRSVFYVNDWEAFASNVPQVELELLGEEGIGHYTLSDPAVIRGLLEAVKADCDAGNMAQNWSLHQDEETEAWLYIYDGVYYASTAYNMQRVYAVSLNVYNSCEHTLAYIDSLGLEIVPYEK